MKTQPALKLLKTFGILLFATVAVFAKAPADITAPDAFQKGLGKVYEGYLNIQQALTQDDFQKAKDVSGSMADSVKAVPTKGLKGSAKTQWDTSSAGISKALKSMAASKDIKSLRSLFKGFTPMMVNAVETFGMKSGSSAYLMHCPMANADWIQKDKSIANPYYGKSMSECGELVKEVKKK